MRVALVHDYLTQYGGAERVLEALHNLYPEAPVFTSFLDLDQLPGRFQRWTIIPSTFQRLPQANRYHRALLPLFPMIFRSFSSALREFDVVIADSSAWSHNVIVRDDAVLICYCHSPARFLYRDENYLGASRLPSIAAQLTPPLFAALRRNDRRAAARVDHYVANSRNVADRIKTAYDREANVIYPPVETQRYAPNVPRRTVEPWYLIVSRLVPHKRIDLAIDACTRLNVPLKIIGSGRSRPLLKERAGPTIEFLGALSDIEAIDHLQRCRALIVPAAEDLGMTAIEAQAAGRPVIAFGEGGALETVIESQTGEFFVDPSIDSLMDALTRFGERQWSTDAALASARRFDSQSFRDQIQRTVQDALNRKRNRPDGFAAKELLS